MTWPQYDARSFDELVRWAALVHYAVAGWLQPAADRTTLPNRLKRLHAAIAGAPKKFGFPKWVARLPIKSALTAEADRYAAEFKSQTRPRAR
jgi:hypothetical protein